MSLAVLIIAGEGGEDDGRGGAALLRLAGQSLLEYQIRIARACGGGHIVVLVEQLPAAMIAMFDHLRADGIDIDVARDARDAADRIHPDEKILLLTPGLAPHRRLVEQLCACKSPTLVTLPDSPPHQAYERIDAHERWSGLAMLAGQTIRETAAMLGDWSISSTLLRQALQTDVARMRQETNAAVAIIENEQDAALLSTVLVSEAVDGAAAYFGRGLFSPLARRVVRWTVGKSVPIELMAALPFVVAGCAVLLALLDWHASAFFLLLLASGAAFLSHLMHDVAVRADKFQTIWRWAQLGTYCLLVARIGWSASRDMQDWSAIILALWSLTLLMPTAKIARVQWAPSVEIGSLIMLASLAVAWPVIGLALLVGQGLLAHVAENRLAG